MTEIIRERIENAEEVITLRVPAAWRGETIRIEMKIEIKDETEPEPAEERTPDPDYNPNWKIGDTLPFAKDREKFSGAWPEGFLKAMYGSAPDLVIEKPGPPLDDIEWLD